MIFPDLEKRTSDLGETSFPGGRELFFFPKKGGWPDLGGEQSESISSLEGRGMGRKSNNNFESRGSYDNCKEVARGGKQINLQMKRKGRKVTSHPCSFWACR